MFKYLILIASLAGCAEKKEMGCPKFITDSHKDTLAKIFRDDKTRRWDYPFVYKLFKQCVKEGE